MDVNLKVAFINIFPFSLFEEKNFDLCNYLYHPRRRGDYYSNRRSRNINIYIVLFLLLFDFESIDSLFE
jgi:hypothetical protein